MESTTFPDGNSTPGVLHYIPNNLCAFEPAKALVRSTKVNTLLWIGGMFDTLGSVSYPFALAQSLGMEWSLITCSLGSAGMSWGVKSLQTDVEDMAKIIAYIKDKRPGGKIVIMGHSTGCQDCMEYIVGKNMEKRPSVDGIILQAPVSDRDALENELPQAHKHEADQLALKMCREGHDKDAMPNRLTKPIFGRIAITARRWLDISSPGPDHSGADDYFSFEHAMERLQGTFGKLPPSTPLLILHGGKDESLAPKVAAAKQIQTWSKVVKESGGNVDDTNSGIVEGASHNLNGNPEQVVQDLIRRVLGFISKIDQNNFSSNTARM